MRGPTFNLQRRGVTEKIFFLTRKMGVDMHSLHYNYKLRTVHSVHLNNRSVDYKESSL